ncbi:pyridoxamine 5'-phosphate oxidase family protein [Flavobacteriaceae bacterium D16]|nr:pyridoxamine 5'-phosphate oxidase family protein [Flavobacteriaceae bacterium D16]
MINGYFDEIRQELTKGATQKGHPFRYFTLGTVGLERLARQRTVVLRRMDDELNLIFYTDARSKKIMHLKENNKVGLLFFHPKKLLQVRIEGLAHEIKDEDTLNKYWSGVQPKARKDYTTAAAPGSLLDDPGQLEYLDEENHFCIVSVQPFKIEYLKLQRPNHIRVRFSKVENLWTSEHLVP